MNIHIVVTKKSHPANVALFEKAMKHVKPTTEIKKRNVSEVVDYIIERRGFK
jgi:ribosomal protein S7